MLRTTSIPAELNTLAQRAADALRELLPETARIYWFGSWVNGTAVERSDIDLGIDLGKAVGSIKMSELRERLSMLPTLRSIDLLDLRELSERRRRKLISEGISL